MMFGFAFVFVQEGGDMVMKEEFFTTAAANESLSPY